MLVSIIAIMTLQYVVICECCFHCGLVCVTSTPTWIPYGAAALFGTSCCDVLYCLFLCFPGLVLFILWVYPPLTFLRLTSLCVAICKEAKWALIQACRKFRLSDKSSLKYNETRKSHLTEQIPYLLINDRKVKEPEVVAAAFNIFSWQLLKI
jgi:hypothetical protein